MPVDPVAASGRAKFVAMEKVETRNSQVQLEVFKDFLKQALETYSIKDPLERQILDGTSRAGKRREEVFTREYLCPAILRYFDDIRASLNLAPEEVQRGLGTEGFRNCSGFGFTPASSRPNLFTKSDVLNPEPPKTWFKSSGRVPSTFQACPDFAITTPLPFSVVGEVKYISRKISPSTAARELYNGARQATFYLAAFRDRYHSALLVIADASEDHSFLRGLDTLHPQLLERFGVITGIHLIAVGLR